MAGLPEEKLVEAHGSFHSAHCVNCRKEYAHEWVKGIKKCIELQLIITLLIYAFHIIH